MVTPSWQTAGDGLGLMIGRDEPPGYVGHAGGGPGSASAVDQFTGYGAGEYIRRTVGAFGPIEEFGIVEARAIKDTAHG